MKIRLLLLLLLSLHLQWCKAQTVTDGINTHRKWMTEHYPVGDTLSDGRLLNEAALAVSYGLREPEAKALLRCAAKRLVPQLNDYVQWVESEKPDYLLKASISALKAIADAAEAKLGRYDQDAAWCRYLYIDRMSDMQNVTPLAQEMIKDQQQAVKRTPTRDAKALLCIMRLSAFTYKYPDEFTIDPKKYDEILDIEQEAMTLYPIKDTTVNVTRAQLYTYLAKVIGDINIISVITEAQKKHDYIDDVACCLTNSNILTAAPFYYEQAGDLFKNLYNEFHPVCFIVNRAHATFVEYNFPVGQDEVDHRQNLRLYADNYYPEGSLESLLARIDLWNCRIMAGQPNNDAMLCSSVIEKLRPVFGEESYNFTGMLANIATISAIDDTKSNSAKILDYYDSLIEKCYGKEPLKQATMIHNVYSALKDKMPERADVNIKKAIALYKENHNATPISISLGEALTSFCVKITSNYKEAAILQQNVCNDAAQYYGDDSMPFFSEELDRIIIVSYTDNNSPETLYPALIDKMEHSGKDAHDILESYAEFEYSKPDYKKAERLFRRLAKYSEEEYGNTKKAYYLLNLVSILGFEKGTGKEREELYKQAQRLLDTDTDTLNIKTVNYEIAAQYLRGTGRYSEAIAMIDRGIELNNFLTSNAFDQEYLNLVTLKMNILYSDLNDMVAAKRLMTQVQQEFDLENQMFLTPLALDFLWNCYDMTYNETNGNGIQSLYYIQPIYKITNDLFIQSGQSKDFLMTYGARAFIAINNFFATMEYWRKITNLDAIPQKQREYFQKMLKQLDEYKNQVPDLLKNLEREYPSYDPNYKNNWIYRAVIDALAKYYNVVSPNPTQAAKYLFKKFELCQNKKIATLNEVYAQENLGDFYLDKNDTIAALNFYQGALLELNKIPTATITDKMELTNRFLHLYYKMSDYEKMLPLARQAYQYMRQIMDGNFQLMTEQEQSNFMEKYNDPAGGLCGLLSKMPEELSKEVYDAVLYRTGMQLRSQRQIRAAIMESDNAELKLLVDSLNQFRSVLRYTGIDAASSTQEQQNYNIKRQAELNYQVNSLEQQIIEASEPYRKKYAIEASWDLIRDKLKADEAAIEFLYSDKHFMALVIRKDYSAPKAVFLARIDSLTARLQALGTRKSANMARKLYNDKAVDLYAMLWQPIEECLQGVNTVYFSAPGLLNNLSFAAFSTPDGGYLIDKYDLRQLTTTAMLLSHAQTAKPTSAVLVGGIYYSDMQRLLVSNGNISAARGEDDDTNIDDFSDRGVTREHFRYLPFTVNEVRNIESKMRGNASIKSSLQVSEAQNATEKALRQLVESHPSVIHLATHGFFIANSADAYRIPFYTNKGQYIDNSMTRAGVALAGAEPSWCGAESDESNDGILTAAEVSNLNLQNTQLVTLSACETALGDYSYEGVFGLPRGFKQAGAKSLLVSLWSVNDKSTAMLMTEFYSLWLGGMPMHDAMRQAVSKLRKQYPQPFYWAPFVLFDAI